MDPRSMEQRLELLRLLLAGARREQSFLERLESVVADAVDAQALVFAVERVDRLADRFRADEIVQRDEQRKALARVTCAGLRARLRDLLALDLQRTPAHVLRALQCRCILPV